MTGKRLCVQLTPLGAAIVEALPDQRRRRLIERRFKRNHECPVSEIFTASEVRAYYRGRGLEIVAVNAAGKVIVP